MGRALRFVLFALSAVFLLQICFPSEKSVAEKGLKFNPDSFPDYSTPEQTVVLENDHIWSLWTARGAFCLEIRLKGFTGEIEAKENIGPDDWLTILRAVPAVPPSPGAAVQPMHHSRRGGMRVFYPSSSLGVALDSAYWVLEEVSRDGSPDSCVFTIDVGETTIRKKVRLDRGSYAFQVDLSARADGVDAGRTLHLRAAT